MAVRAPLYWDTVNGDVRAMTAAQITSVCQRMIYQYSLNPSAILTYTAGTGNLTAIDDTRMQAGVASTSTTAFVSEALTADISVVTTTHQNVTFQTNGPAQYPVDALISYPVYWDSTAGEIRAMTQQDMIDTFVNEAVGYLAAGNTEATSTNKGGIYFLSTSNSVAGATLVDANPVYVDTRADLTLYSAASIPESVDQPEDINSYYLHVYNGDAAAGALVPLTIDITGGVTDLRTPPDATWDNFLSGFIRYAVESENGYRLTYEFDTSTGSTATGGAANLVGSAIVDTRLNGTSAAGYNTRLVNADDYRSQEFPNGVPITINTYGLYVVRV